MADNKYPKYMIPPILMGNNVMGDQDATYEAPNPDVEQPRDIPDFLKKKAYDPFGAGENGDYDPKKHGATHPAKHILAQLGLSLAQSIGDALSAHFTPDVYKQNQESKRLSIQQIAEDARQEKQLKAQQALHMMITPAQQSEMDQREFENKSKIAAGVANGTLQQAPLEGTVLQGIGKGPMSGGVVDPNASLDTQAANLPTQSAVQTLSQAPKPFLQAGGAAANPVPDALGKAETFTVEPDSNIGKLLGLKKTATISKHDMLEYGLKIAEKNEADAAKAETQKATVAELNNRRDQAHKDLDSFVTANPEWKNDPAAMAQIQILHNGIDTAAVSDKKVFGNTAMTQVERDIRNFRPESQKIKDAIKQAQATRVTPDHGQNVVGSDGVLRRIEPGQALPPGAQTIGGVNTMNTPTSQMRNVAAQAQLVHEQTPHMLGEIDRLKDKLGPVVGRWGEFMQGKVGMNDPDLAGLRADLLMYSSAVALMHARGRLPENLREEFDHAINNPSQTPANLKTIISRIDDWTTKNAAAMGAGGGVQQPKATKRYNPASGKLEPIKEE